MIDLTGNQLIFPYVIGNAEETCVLVFGYNNNLFLRGLKRIPRQVVAINSLDIVQFEKCRIVGKIDDKFIGNYNRTVLENCFINSLVNEFDDYFGWSISLKRWVLFRMTKNDEILLEIWKYQEPHKHDE